MGTAGQPRAQPPRTAPEDQHRAHRGRRRALLDIADADERDRVAAVVDDPSRLDLATISHAERVLQHYRRQGDVLGPQIALQTALAQRQVIADLVASAPEELRPGC
ncbi:hypothetical protein ACFQ3Z_26655 [Streptomyces nogalater]